MEDDEILTRAKQKLDQHLTDQHRHLVELETCAGRLRKLVEEERTCVERLRNPFSVAAIADALSYREEEQDCVTVVEQALADMDAGRGLVPFEEVRRQWEAEKDAHEKSDNG